MFEGDEYFYLVLELVSGGELFEHLIQDGAYSEQTAAAILRDLAGALRFLHRRGIVHADLKPENLMLSSWNDEDASVSREIAKRHLRLQHSLCMPRAVLSLG